MGAATFAFVGTASAAPPANDDFANRQVISGASGSVNGTTVESTTETGENSFFTWWGGSDPYEGGVWYSWTAPANGPVAFRTTNIGTTDTILAAETGTGITDLQTVVYNDDYPFCCPSRILFNAVNGTTYYIGVGPLWFDDPSYYGTFTLEWGGSSVNYFDQRSPILSASGTGGKRSLTLNFSATDDTASVVGSSWLTFECSVNGGAYSTCTNPAVFTASPGPTTWSVRATDGAGNAQTVNGQAKVKGGPKL